MLMFVSMKTIPLSQGKVALVDDEDYEWLMQLLDTYDSVVEFSAYDRAVGILPIRNTIIWEVRNY